MIASFSLNKGSNTPPLASKQAAYKMVSSVPRKLSDLLLKFFMNILRTANETDAAHAISMRFDGFMCSFDHFGMRGKPEIIIGAKIQNGFAVHYDLCALWAGNYPFSFVESGSFYFLNFLRLSCLQNFHS